MWGAGLRTISAMLLLICARHNDRMLSRRSPSHVMDFHFNPTLISHIEKVIKNLILDTCSFFIVPIFMDMHCVSCSMKK